MKRFNTLEINYLRRSEGILRWERVKNVVIRERASVQQTILKRIERRYLKWFSHLMRMEQGKAV